MIVPVHYKFPNSFLSSHSTAGDVAVDESGGNGVPSMVAESACIRVRLNWIRLDGTSLASVRRVGVGGRMAISRW